MMKALISLECRKNNAISRNFIQQQCNRNNGYICGGKYRCFLSPTSTTALRTKQKAEKEMHNRDQPSKIILYGGIRRNICNAINVPVSLQPFRVNLPHHNLWNLTSAFHYSYSSTMDTIKRQEGTETSSFLITLNQQQKRSFASGGKKRGKNNDDNAPLLNEKLVQFLIARSQSKSSDDIEVRLLMDTKPKKRNNNNVNAEENKEEKPSIQVVTLSKAIDISLESNSDLIGIANIEKNKYTTKADNKDKLSKLIPVIKVTSFSGLVFQQTKKLSKREKEIKNTTGGNKIKEYRFRSQSGEGDVDRKVNNICKALKKGNKVKISTRCNRAYLAENPDDAVKKVVDAILTKIEQHVSYEIVSPLDVNKVTKLTGYLLISKATSAKEKKQK